MSAWTRGIHYTYAWKYKDEPADDIEQRTQPVDLVLMDMKMPVMDGRTATSEIRKFNAEIPIIALTAHAFDADRVAALKAGCDDYLVKPINGAKLMQTLKEYGC